MSFLGLDKFRLKQYDVLFSTFFGLLLFSKFYYLLGVQEGTIFPKAPVALILLRDFMSFSFLVIFGIKAFPYFKEMKFFWWMWGGGLVISLLHLGVAKDLPTWGQHYFRNVLMPLLFIPVIYGNTRAGFRINWKWIFAAIFLLNLGLNYYQFISSVNVIRPPGFFGDALINMMMLLWSLSAIVLAFPWYLGFFALALTILPIEWSSAVSPLVSLVIGWGIFLIVFGSRWLRVVLAVLIFLGATSVPFVVGYLKKNVNSATVQNNSGLSGKISVFYDNLTCTGLWCHEKNWSYIGRVKSNIRPFEFCGSDFGLCLVGNVSDSSYEKVESTWGSLVVNWGAIFTISFFGLFIFSLISIFRNLKKRVEGSSDHIMLLVLMSGTAFLFMSVVHYRYPLNIIIGAVLAALFADAETKGAIRNR